MLPQRQAGIFRRAVPSSWRTSPVAGPCLPWVGGASHGHAHVPCWGVAPGVAALPSAFPCVHSGSNQAQQGGSVGIKGQQPRPPHTNALR